MAIDERGRHELYAALERLMGSEQAEALMGLLPPVGWADVATKHDLAALEHRLRADFRGDLEAGLRSQMRALFFGVFTMLAAMTSLILAAIAR